MNDSPEIASMTVRQFADALSEKRPVPGGGAAAAVVLAHAAALGSMVIAYTTGKKAFAAHESRLAHLATFLAGVRAEALLLADRDARAYLTLNALWKLPPDQRTSAPGWSTAVDEAIAAPRTIADLALATLAAVRALDGVTTASLRSDLLIGARFAQAALEGGLLNVEANLPSVTDAARATELRAFIDARRAEGDAMTLAANPGG